MLSISNKKGMEAMMIVTLIAIMISAAILIMFVIKIGSIGKDATNVQAVQTWVDLSVSKEKVSKGFAKTTRPPVSDVSGTIEIKSKGQLLDSTGSNGASILIGDAVVDCWNAFRKGEVDFIKSVLGGDKTFCFSCAQITFSEELKSLSQPAYKSFKQDLKDTRIGAGAYQPSYLEYLSNIKNCGPPQIPYSLDTTKTYYIYYYEFPAETRCPKIIIGDSKKINQICGGI